MDQQVYITGSGIICAIGQNTDEVRESLEMERTGIARLQFIETRHRDVLSVGEVKSSNGTLQSRLDLPTSLPLTRTALLGLTAAREAMFQAGITGSDPFRTGLISATSVGGMDIVENHFQSFIDQESRPEHLNYIHHLDCSASTEQIAQYLGIRSFLSTISTACSSSANAIMYGARLIRHNLLDRVLVGGTDALSRFTINGFHCLQILDPEPCKPFDRDRAGLNLGEGAGYLVLESEKALGKRQPIARLSGYSNVNDAYHQTASSPPVKALLMPCRSRWLKVDCEQPTSGILMCTAPVRRSMTCQRGWPCNDCSQAIPHRSAPRKVIPVTLWLLPVVLKR